MQAAGFGRSGIVNAHPGSARFEADGEGRAQIRVGRAEREAGRVFDGLDGEGASIEHEIVAGDAIEMEGDGTFQNLSVEAHI